MAANSPRTLLLIGALLLAASATAPVAAAGDSKMVTVHAARTAGGGPVARETATWQRRLEDAVAPEFPSAAIGGGLGGPAYRCLGPDREGCVRLCAAKCAGCSYTRPCTYGQMCTQGHN